MVLTNLQRERRKIVMKKSLNAWVKDYSAKLVENFLQEILKVPVKLRRDTF